MDILGAVDMAAKECLPRSGGSNTTSTNDIVPGWSEYVKPYSEDGWFWNATWLSAGKPRHGHLFDAMMKSKCQYKYSVRRLKRANQSIQNYKFVDEIILKLIYFQRSKV